MRIKMALIFKIGAIATSTGILILYWENLFVSDFATVNCLIEIVENLCITKQPGLVKKWWIGNGKGYQRSNQKRTK